LFPDEGAPLLPVVVVLDALVVLVEIVVISVTVVTVVIVLTVVKVVTEEFELPVDEPVVSTFRPEITIGDVPVLLSMTSKKPDEISGGTTSLRFPANAAEVFGNQGSLTMFGVLAPTRAVRLLQSAEGMDNP
jgi:hypothetical protein